MPTKLTDLAMAQADVAWRDKDLATQAPYNSDREKARHSFATAIYKVDGTETTGDIINIIDLPVGAVVIPDACKVITNGIGGTGAITTLGDAGSISRYSSTSIAVASAGVNAVTSTTAVMVANPPTRVTAGNETLKATLTFASAITVGNVVVFRIAYILP